jgi:predicted regulator of Ras-like GTPase activity (Roadblock/LC7/MglB family)
MTDATADSRDLSWLVDSFSTKVSGVANTLVVSADGLPLALSRHLDRASADQLAAIASGLASLTYGAARCLGAGAVKQVIVEMDQGYMFVMAISDGSVLTVLASPSADLGLVAYEMALLVTRVGSVLTPALRTAIGSASPT